MYLFFFLGEGFPFFDPVFAVHLDIFGPGDFAHGVHLPVLVPVGQSLVQGGLDKLGLDALINFAGHKRPFHPGLVDADVGPEIFEPLFVAAFQVV